MFKRHWPSCSRRSWVVLGLLTSSFLLLFIVRYYDGSTYDESFQILVPYFATDERGSTYHHNSVDSVYEHELMSILDKLEAEGAHNLVKPSRRDVECSRRNFTKEFSKCFRGENVRCGRRYLPEKPKERIKSFLKNKNIRIAPQYQQVLKEMASKVEGQYEVIIVSALSSNHYAESQAMLRELHEKIFPLLSSYLLVVYDLGLSKDEHLEYQKHCRCKLIKFPFHDFPDYVQTLKCFGWKPAVLRAHFDNAKLVIWMDASVRYHDPKGLLRAMELARTYGVQQRRSTVFVPNPSRAMPKAFLFFGDSPCAHLSFTQAESNWGIYRTSPLIKDIVMDSWVSCGLNSSCTCPAYPDLKMLCPPPAKRIGKYGTCQRPQFAIAAILAKLYMEHYNAVVDKGASFMKILRSTKLDYFSMLTLNSSHKTYTRRNKEV